MVTMVAVLWVIMVTPTTIIMRSLMGIVIFSMALPTDVTTTRLGTGLARLFLPLQVPRLVFGSHGTEPSNRR